jgi:hypothetical protein
LRRREYFDFGFDFDLVVAVVDKMQQHSIFGLCLEPRS